MLERSYCWYYSPFLDKTAKVITTIIAMTKWQRSYQDTCINYYGLNYTAFYIKKVLTILRDTLNCANIIYIFRLRKSSAITYIAVVFTFQKFLCNFNPRNKKFCRCLVARVNPPVNEKGPVNEQKHLKLKL